MAFCSALCYNVPIMTGRQVVPVKEVFMTLQECYIEMGGDYADVTGRLPERMVKKFALKFLNDPNFELLRVSLRDENWEEAFRAAHTMKGVCGNLGFARLLRTVEAITEPLRPEHEELRAASDLKALFADLEREYNITLAALAKLDP